MLSSIVTIDTFGGNCKQDVRGVCQQPEACVAGAPGPVGGAPAPALAGGAAVPGAGPSVGIAVVGGTPAGPNTWVLVETTTVGKRGFLVTVGCNEHIVGGIGVLTLGAGESVLIRNIDGIDPDVFRAGVAAGDARLCAVVSIPGERRKLQWRQVVERVRQIPVADWGIPGPRTTLWCCRFIDRRQGGPLEHFRFWWHMNGLSKNDWGSHTI
jgi:hypothetical protein